MTAKTTQPPPTISDRAPAAPEFPAGWRYEVFWLGTSASGASADCAILRWDSLARVGESIVAVVDAGRNKADLALLVDHLLNEIGATHIDYLIGTHSDRDHIGNVASILDHDELSVGELWLHDPRNHLDVYSVEMNAIPRPPVVASIGDVHKINKSTDDSIVRREPFAGVATADGVLTVLGPSEDYYRELLPGIFDEADVREIPTRIAAALAIDTHAHEAYELVLPGKAETWTGDNLAPNNPKRASNDVSVISLMKLPGGHQILLTGDASARSFSSAKPDVGRLGLDPEKLLRVQLPHHGSWSNVTSTLLDELLGPIIGSEAEALGEAESRKRVCVAQTGADDSHHPSSRVANAAIRRGWRVLSTAGKSWRQSNFAAASESRYRAQNGTNISSPSPYASFNPYPES